LCNGTGNVRAGCQRGCNMETDSCTICKKVFPIEQFTKLKSSKKGYRRQCYECARVLRKKQYDKYPERAKEYSKAYRKAHPEKCREYTKRHNDKKRAATVSTVTYAHIKAQYKRQKGKCHWCRVSVWLDYDVDHIVPLDRGGAHAPENIVISCVPCNRKKSNKLPSEWVEGGRLL
jgi:5-methylcytosine-specific restriction endonuclease McrA